MPVSKAKTWPAITEIVGITIALRSTLDNLLPVNYGSVLHAWFLKEIRKNNPALSAYLHDRQSEKAFTLSPLKGKLLTTDDRLFLPKGELYYWTITALYQPLCEWLSGWQKLMPTAIKLKYMIFSIEQIDVALPATTYYKIFNHGKRSSKFFTLSFTSPTGFRSRGHHLPLPIPRNIFQSYLRRWFDFSGQSIDAEDFLDWVEAMIYIDEHDISTTKTTPAKRDRDNDLIGVVTGFTGLVKFGVDRHAKDIPEYIRLLQALIRYAPYCGTGHKTTFGLGQTRSGVAKGFEFQLPAIAQIKLADRIAELSDIFLAQRKRPDNDRSRQITTTWATVLARREFGESLQEIAADLELNYQTAKTYVKLSRREYEG